jgi:hypothetical protein
MPSIKFDTIVETSKVVSGFRDIQNAVHQTSERVEKDGKTIDDVISKIQNSFNIAIGGWSIGKFVNQMMQVRGQFQQTEMAFKTMLQSEEKADALMKQLIRTAAVTPFGVEDVTEGAKQLLAFNVAAEDVNKTLIGLGDVAAGMGLNLKDLVMLYGTTIAKGKMDTMDLYQFLNRGIPIADEIAKVMGLDVTNAIKEVQKQIKAGKVTSDIFIQAMQSMTAEGSKFGGLMEAQSKTITGQISNIEDAIEQMFNDLGKSQEGIINAGLGVVSYLADNWKSVGNAVMVAATAYGSYKAVLMTVNALQVLNTKVLRLAVVEKRASAAAGITLSNAEAIAAAKTKLLTVAQKGLTVALKETAKATLLNPYVLLAAAITSVVVAIYSYVNRISSAEAAENALAKSLDNTNQKLDDRNQKLQDLIHIIQSVDSTDLQKQLAFDELSKLAPSITDVYDSVDKLAKADLSQLNQQLNELSDEKREESLKVQVEELKKLYKDLESFSISGGDNDGRFRGAVAHLKNQFGLDLGWAANSQDWKDAVSDLIAGLQKQLFDIEEAKKKIAEPTKIDVELAKDKYEQSKEQLDYLSKFALAMKNDIERNPTEIPFDGGEADRVIAELEKKANDLKLEQIKNPIQFTADKQKALGKYQELLADIKRWKNTAWSQGTFTIPVEIQFKMKQLQEETNKAKGRFNYLTGKYEESNKDVSYAAAKKQAKIAYQAAVKAEKEARKGSNKKWEESKEDLDNKKKEYEKYWGSISSANSKSNKAAATDAKKQAEDRKKAQEELNEDLKQLEQQNQDDAISIMQEGTDKKLAEIKNDYAKRKAEIDKQEAEFKKKNKEAGKKEALTSAQTNALNKARDLATQEYNKKLDEVNREALTSMRDYLKEYGSLYQQKQAIAEEYEEKIAKAQTEGEKKTLQQEKKKALANFDYESISMGIDWKGLMSGVGNMSKEMLKPMLEKLDAYTNTDKFQQADTQTQQKVVDLMQEIRTYLGTDQNATWQNLAASISSFNQSVAEYQKAVEEEKRQSENFKSAKALHDKGSISDKELQQAKKATDDASQAVVDAKNKMNTFGIKLNSATEAVTNYTSGLTAALNKLGTWKGNEGFSEVQSSVGNIDALKGVLDESLSTMGNGVAKTMGATISKGLGSALDTIGGGITNMMGSALGSIIGVVAQIPKLILNLASSIKSFVTGILDSFTQLLQFEWLSDLVDSILASVGNLIDAIFDLPENLFKALESIVVNGVGGLLDNVLGRVGNILSLGALSSKGPSDWFTNSNAEKVQKTIDRLTDRNELLQQSIEDLTDAMENSFGSKATSYYEQAYKNQQETNQNYLDIAKAQASYHGSHHSWNAYWGGFGSDEMDWIKKNVKSDFNGDLFSLSPEEMKLLRGNVAIWEHIENTGKGNYGGRLTEKLNDYIDQAGKLEELSEQFKENLTQISFSGMRDSFLTDLMDMKKDGSDFASEMADDFAEKMQKSLLSFSMEDLINGDLKKLYDDWAKAMKDKNGKLTKEDVDAFYKRYDDIVQEGLKRRDEWAKVTGYTGSSSSSQTATSGGWASMGQDTADELNGRFTALQIAGESIAQNMTTTISQMESIVTLGISTNGAVLEIRNMMIMTNSYLEDIVKYSKLTYNDFGNKLDDMNRRLKDI